MRVLDFLSTQIESFGEGLTFSAATLGARCNNDPKAERFLQYAGKGAMRWRAIENNGRSGLELQFADQGPGITDINVAFQDGYSTGEGLGMGLTEVFAGHLGLQLC